MGSCMSIVEEKISVGFRNLQLSEEVHLSLEALGYEIPTPIQAKAIPQLLDGRDVLGQAQTGTGKTAAFALPLLSRLDMSERRPQVLVLAPTRELAIQVCESFERYARFLPGFRAAAIYGGQSYTTQESQLRRGAHVVVGTPGRIMDLMRKGTLKLDAVRCLVLDEADEMLRMGFIEDVQWILQQTPPGRQMALFSATMPPPIRRIADEYLRHPAIVTIEGKKQAAETVRQRFLVSLPRNKVETLARVLESEPTDGVIVFVKTKVTTAELAEELLRRGYKVAPLSGDVAQNQRQRTVEQLKSGQLDMIVATDVAARGLDVQRISHVINYDMPVDIEAYIHRIGRTGRAGRSGEAILFTTPREQGFLKAIQRATRQPIEEMQQPSVAEINEQRIGRFKQRITTALESPQLELFTRLAGQYQQESGLPPEQIAAALAVMAQGSQPLLLMETPRNKSNNRRNESFEGDNAFVDRGPPRGKPGRELGRGDRGRPGNDQGMDKYRIEVGHDHGAKPGNIVGAIANEAGIDSCYIGGIKIFSDYTTVDLPEGLPEDLLRILERTWVSGRQLRISKLQEFRSPRFRGKRKSPIA